MQQLALFLSIYGILFSSLFAEKAAEAEFAKQDQILNEVYQQLKKELEPNIFEIVRNEQRDWVGYRDFVSEWQKGYEEVSDKQAQLEMAAGMTESQIVWLKAWKTTRKGAGLEGEYRDAYGGVLQVVKEGGKYYFSLVVVRGPTFHLGQLGGKLRVNGSSAWFETRADGEDLPTWLTFVPEGDGSGRVKIVSENAHFFHGARAYFDGSYLRVGEVSVNERAKVISGEW